MRVFCLRATLALLLVGSLDAVAAEVRDVGAIPVATLALPMTAAGPSEAAALGGALARGLRLNASSSLRPAKTLPLPGGRGWSLRYDQLFRGVPIWGRQVIARQSADGRLAGLSGTAVFDIDETGEPSPTPGVSAAEAMQIGRDSIRGRLLAPPSPIENEASDLTYIHEDGRNLRLVYRVTFFTMVRGETGRPRPTRPVLFVDADTGAIVSAYENIQHAGKGLGPGGNGKTGKYFFGTGPIPAFPVTKDGRRCVMGGGGVLTENLDHQQDGNDKPFVFHCPTNTVKEINGAYSPLNDAQAFGKATVDMFRDWYGIDPLRRKVHLRVHFITDFDNAFWDGSAANFGDGDAQVYPMTTLDVVGHEIAHGFTEQNSGLTYRGQSAAINEAFSDMAGEAAEVFFVQRYGNPFGKAMPDLESGGVLHKAPGVASRYMCDPPKDGRSIGHADDYSEEMGSHEAAGVFNKAFCLLSKRPGWDLRRAFDVFVAANQHYWTPDTDFERGAAGVLGAAEMLGYPTADVIAAFSEVGLGLPLLGVGAETSSFAGERGGEFEPRSLVLTLNASSGSVSWRLDGLPNWLRASAKKGTTTQSGTTVTLSLRKAARNLRRSDVATLVFTNLTAPNQKPVRQRIRILVDGEADGKNSGASALAED